MRKDEKLKIPLEFEYSGISGLSNELKSKLNTVRPANMAQAGRVEGMTPAALALILAVLRQSKQKSA